MCRSIKLKIGEKMFFGSIFDSEYFRFLLLYFSKRLRLRSSFLAKIQSDIHISFEQIINSPN